MAGTHPYTHLRKSSIHLESLAYSPELCVLLPVDPYTLYRAAKGLPTPGISRLNRPEISASSGEI